MNPNVNNTTDGNPNNDPSADPDNDGLTNYDEYLNNTNPYSVDSDGDNVNDPTEIAQGSNPMDDSDEGQPPPADEIIELPFSIGGDWAAWEMTVTGINGADTRVMKLRMSSPADSKSVTFKLHKGNSYSVTMSWLGSGEHIDPYWYCWEAQIDGLPAAQAYGNPDSVHSALRVPGVAETVVGDGWFAQNADGLLTTHVHSSDNGSGNIAGRLTAVLHVVKVEFVDEMPDYSLESNTDSDNFFLREYDGSDNPDSKDLYIYYRILPENVPVSDVKIKIYQGDTSTLETTLKGEKDTSGDFKIGDTLHTNWTPSVDLADDHPGFYRLQLEVYVDGQTDPICQTSIDDADASTDGWQCPQDCLAIHDLHWKHRPIIHSHPADIGRPSDISRFITHSSTNGGNHTKEWTNNVLVVHNPIQMPHNQNTFFDLFDDDKATVGDLNGDFTSTQRDDVLATESAAETVYYTAVQPDGTGGASNFAFLQYWMFYNFSTRMFGIPGDLNPPNVSHEGDMEHCQIAVQMKDAADPSNKSAWVVPFGATASQHYYAQTLRWDIDDGSAAANAHSQVHVEHQHNRLVVYSAAGAHATYLVADNAIAVPITNTHLGTQTMYDRFAPLLFDTTATNPQPLAYDFESLHDWLAEFKGRWGYFDSTLTGVDANANGPAGPPYRSATISNTQTLNLRDNARELHNRAIKTVAPSQITEMTISQ